MEKILLDGDNGEKIELYVLEVTKLAGIDYVLASDVEQGDGECYILQDVSEAGSDVAVYEMVTDEQKLDSLLNVFAELLEDVDLEF